jgi:8-oxo-dGTP pyrophosphatase MutT (NUDIX family)
MPPVHRTSARVLPVSPEGEVLLLQGRDPARPEDLHWVSIGGAVEPGESLVEGALRELREETGIVAAPHDLTPPVHRGSHGFSWDGVDYLSDSTFFALPLPRDVEVRFDLLEPAEVGNVLRAAWWTPEALAADGTAAAEDMPRIMAAAIVAVGGAR